MKKNYILIGILILTFDLVAQCDFGQIINFTTGITKFQLSNRVLLNKNATNFKHRVGYWDTPDYLKNDSVRLSFASFNFISSNCFGNNKNEVSMRFADDTLYKIDLSIDFIPSDLDKCLQSYNEFVKFAKQSYPIYANFTSSNDETNEQNGEGFWLYKNSTDKYSPKLKQLSIGYTIIQERIWNDRSEKWYYTGKIEKYVLEIKYVDLTHTKYTKSGY